MPDRIMAGLDRLHDAVVEESNKLDQLTARLDDFVTAEVVTDRVDDLERREGRRRWRDRAAVLVLVLGLFTVNRAGVVDACHRDNETRAGFRALLVRAETATLQSPGLTADQRRETIRFYQAALHDVRPAPCHWLPRP